MTIAFDMFVKESNKFVEEKLISYSNELKCP
ncbi:polyprenyl synthetase family protein, partial [Bacillus cereus]|nr:polyprenyl synthetase family protein [Bacillus cereus]